MPEKKPTAPTLRAAEARARDEDVNEVVVQSPPLKPPARYEQSFLGMSKGAKEMYRTPNPEGHFQLRVYDEYWTVQYDQYHPKHYPARHAAVDAPMITLIGIATFGAYLS